MNIEKRACQALIAGLACFFASSAIAGGVHPITLTTIPIARTPITIDGNLSDWPDTRPVTFVPINPGLVKSNASAMTQLRRLGAAADLQACYDSKALYVGITWSGLSRASGSASIDLNVLTDRVVHIHIASVAAGKRQTIQERIGDKPAWHSLALTGAKSVSAAKVGAVIQEICIPWSDLTRTGATAATMTLGVDLEWSALSPSFIKQLPAEALHASTHLTGCFLTASSAQFGMGQYLSDPNTWGRAPFC